MGQVLVNVTKTFQKYWPVEDGPVTSQDCCVSIKKCPLRLTRGKGERTKRALGLGPQRHDVQLGETLYCSGPSSPNGKMMVGGTISRFPKLEDSLAVESQASGLGSNFNQRADQALVPWRLSWGVRSGRSTICVGSQQLGLAWARRH